MKKYKRIQQFKIKVYDKGNYVKWEDIRKALNKPQLKLFGKYFGIQTCDSRGPFPWDVEAVLERIVSKKLTGTQLDWD